MMIVGHDVAIIAIVCKFCLSCTRLTGRECVLKEVLEAHNVAERRTDQCPSMSFPFLCSRCQVMCSTPKMTTAKIGSIRKHDDPAGDFHLGEFYSKSCFNVFIFSRNCRGWFR